MLVDYVRSMVDLLVQYMEDFDLELQAAIEFNHRPRDKELKSSIETYRVSIPTSQISMLSDTQRLS